MGKRELVALLSLSSLRLLMVVWLFIGGANGLFDAKADSLWLDDKN